MGTSTSQPSPKERNQAGREWKEVQRETKNGSSANKIISATFMALNSQYKGIATKIIVDEGVCLVEEEFRKISQKQFSHPEETASKFLHKLRSRLTIQGKNSFLADMALQSALRTIGFGANINDFMCNYISKYMEYVVSRDMPTTFGSSGAVTPDAIREKISKINEAVVSKSKKLKPENLTVFVESLLRDSESK